MKLKKTYRGLKRGEFKDYLYGNACSIQESSLVKPRCPGRRVIWRRVIWLGQDGFRMLLDRGLAKQLIRHLQKFVETGGL